MPELLLHIIQHIVDRRHLHRRKVDVGKLDGGNSTGGNSTEGNSETENSALGPRKSCLVDPDCVRNHCFAASSRLPELVVRLTDCVRRHS